LVINKDKDTEKQILDLIDMGIEDVEEIDDAIEAYVKPTELSQIRTKVEGKGYKIISAELEQKPKSYQTIINESDAKKALNFLDQLEEQDDVQKVSTNLDIPEEVFAKIS
jgi:transcriptional/translational regulatory protein YebC/TACO1